MPFMIAPSQPFSIYSLVLQQEERPRAEGLEPPLSQPTNLCSTGRDTAENNPALSRWHVGTKSPFKWQHLSCSLCWPENKEMNISVLAVRSSLKWVGQNLKIVYVYNVNSTLWWLYLSSWPLARTQLGKKCQLKPGEVLPSWQASISPVTQALMQMNPPGWVAWKQGREGRQLLHHRAVKDRRSRRRRGHLWETPHARSLDKYFRQG